MGLFDQAGQTTPTNNPYGANPFQNSSNPYIQAAQQTAQGNVNAANTATAANRVNQSTPYSNLQYQQTGTDANGNPIWSANQTLAPQFQNTFNNLTNQANANYQNPFNSSQYQQQMVGQGPQFNQVGTAQQAQGVGQSPQFAGVGNAPQLQTGVQGTGMQGWDTATNLLMSRLQPQMQQASEANNAALANQGIPVGSKAYENQMRTFNQGQNDLQVQAQLAGSQLQNQMFNQNLAAGNFGNQALQNQNTMNLGNTQFNNQLGQQGFANQLAGTQLGNQASQQNFANQLAGAGFNNQTGQQGFANQMAGTAANNAATQTNLSNALNQYNMPMQQLAGLKSITSPTYVNPYTQAAVAAPDYLGAYSTANAADIAKSNAQMAQQNNLTNGLLGLGSSALLGGTGSGSVLGSLGGGLTDLYKYFGNLGSGTSAINDQIANEALLGQYF